MNNLNAWISHTNDGRAIVYLSATKRGGDIPNASQAIAGSVFEAFMASFRDFSAGLLSAQVPVNATHLGSVVDGDVDISACLMFLVKAGLKKYWVANFGRFTRLSALWQHIHGCLGYSAGEFRVVHDEYMRAVMANHSISTAPLHRVVDVHDRKLKCFNKIVHGHAAHVPFVWLSPHISTVRDHIQVGRVPKTAVGLLSKKLSYVVEKKIEPLVKVCPFETKPQFFGYVYRRPTADAWIKG